MDKKLEQQHQKWKINPIKLTAELVSGGFSDFLTHRSRFEEEIHIKQLLVEEMKNRPDFFWRNSIKIHFVQATHTTYRTSNY